MFQSRFIQKSLRFSAVVAVPSLIACINSRAQNDYSVHFDNKGFPLETIPSISKKAQPLYLSGVGMRRKNLYIVEVDIYKVGFCLSADALKKGKEAIQTGQKISDLVLDEETVNSYASSDIVPALSVPLIFVRSVSTNTIVDAFNDAFIGCNPDGVNLFKTRLREAIGTGGMNLGDEVTFYWLRGGGIIIAKNNIFSGLMKNKEIEKRLLDVYVDPSRTVSPDLVKCIENHMRELSQE